MPSVQTIEKLVIKALEHNRSMTKDELKSHIEADLGNGEEQSQLIDKVVESMADRMIILENAVGKYMLNIY